ncbi:MAG: GDP-mannose 4,6-dehydratase [Alphaproteobacteria bacterium]|jgi:UDP-glucuronate 4-epimerase
MNILLTGYAGFIGFHLTLSLIKDKSIKNIYGLDNLNKYYDINLKKNRLKLLRIADSQNKLIEFNFDIKNDKKLKNSFKNIKIDAVINLAAQAGVRYSFINPKSYIDTNIVGFFNILELVKNKKILKLIFASTSSSYGSQSITPYREDLMNNTPLQLYAATKISNEVMAHSYSHLYGFKSIGLRFFTVYGPYGRPDMAIYKFTDAIYKNKKIDLYGSGKMLRDCTYVDDIVIGIIKTLKNKTTSRDYNHNIYNIGYGNPVTVKTILKEIEKNTNKKANIRIIPKHNSEMDTTYCSNIKFNKKFNFKAKTDINEGLKKFNDWYKSYYLK